MRIVCVVGSLRKQSFNRVLYNTLVSFAPPSISIEEAAIGDVPLFNADDETNVPESVLKLKTALEEADGIIIITPEYNRSVPGVLKNAIDWASRPGGMNSWKGKPVAIMGATPGSVGTSAAQAHLRGVLVHLSTKLMGQPEFMLNHVQDKLSEDRTVIADEETRARIVRFLEAFQKHIQS